MLPLWRRGGGEVGRRFDDGRILRSPPVSGTQFLIGLVDLVRSEDGEGAAPEQLGAVGVLLASEPIEALDELVIELDEDFLAGHDTYGNPYGR